MRRLWKETNQMLLMSGLLAGMIGIACGGTSVEEEATVGSTETIGTEIGTEIGHTAPNFEVYTMDGTKVTLEDFRGRPLFVNFWAWWCPPCIRDAEPLMNIAKKYEGRIDFLFVGVNKFYRDEQPLDPAEFEEGFGPGLETFKQGLLASRLVRPSDETEKNDPDKMAGIAVRNDKVIEYYMTSPTSLFDFRGYWERQFRAKTNQRYGIPVTYLIDGEGRIKLDVHPNDQHWDKHDDILEDLIAGKDLSHYAERFPIPPKHQREEASGS